MKQKIGLTEVQRNNLYAITCHLRRVGIKSGRDLKDGVHVTTLTWGNFSFVRTFLGGMDIRKELLYNNEMLFFCEPRSVFWHSSNEKTDENISKLQNVVKIKLQLKIGQDEALHAQD